MLSTLLLVMVGTSALLVSCGDSEGAASEHEGDDVGQDDSVSQDEQETTTTEPVPDEVVRPVRAGPLDQVIPQPVSVTSGEGRFALTESTTILVEGDADAGAAAGLLQGMLAPVTGLDLPILEGEAGSPDELPEVDETTPLIRFQPAPGDRLGDEGYRLVVEPDEVKVVAGSAQGFGWAVQTIRQMLPPAVEGQEQVDGTLALPAGTIEDQPRFAWRGVMLDVARHFYPVEDVKHLIDLASAYKFNRIHLHLSDDQGWRLEIQAYPQLTELGSTNEVGGGEGGFYTQEQYADLVSYAAERGMTVVPEIDMPGHTNAALHAVPELNCDGQAPEPYTGTQVGFSSLCIDSEKTYEFVEQVIAEVASITPGPYLHIGGDEAHSTTHDDYVTFMQRVAPVVAAEGKTLVGWDEVGTVDLGQDVVAQYWGSAENAAAAGAQGMKMLMSPATHTYMDMRYNPSLPGNDWAGTTDTPDAYEWEPTELVDGVSPDQVLGVEAALWTELLSTREEMEARFLPRLPGVAEVGWSPEGRNWDEYSQRLILQAARWDKAGIAYTRDPAVPWE